PAGRPETAYCRLEVFDVGFQQSVGHALAGLSRENPVDQRRSAVMDRGTDHGITVWCRLVHRSPLFGCDSETKRPRLPPCRDTAVIPCRFSNFSTMLRVASRAKM